MMAYEKAPHYISYTISSTPIFYYARYYPLKWKRRGKMEKWTKNRDCTWTCEKIMACIVRNGQNATELDKMKGENREKLINQPAKREAN